MWPYVEVNDAISLTNEIGLIQNHNHLWCLNNLQGNHRSTWNPHRLAIILRIIGCAGTVLALEDLLHLGSVFWLVRRLNRLRPIVLRPTEVSLASKQKLDSAVLSRLPAVTKRVVVKSA